MVQLTLRVPDALADGLRREARDRGVSVNALATNALTALVDPDFAGTEAGRLRARLAAAGLLAASDEERTPPPPAAVVRAQRAIKPGKPFSQYVSEDRGA